MDGGSIPPISTNGPLGCRLPLVYAVFGFPGGRFMYQPMYYFFPVFLAARQALNSSLTPTRITHPLPRQMTLSSHPASILLTHPTSTPNDPVPHPTSTPSDPVIGEVIGK